MKLRLYFTYITILLSVMIFGQADDLEAMLEGEMEEQTEYVLGTFLSTYVLTNHSIELLEKNGLNIRMSHKFDFLNSGSENGFGFDHASVFTEVEYAPTDWLNLGIGRATANPSINSHAKIRLLRQSTGKVNTPLSLVLFTEADYITGTLYPAELDESKVDRLMYSTQLLMARKFGRNTAVQLMPTYLHKNLVETRSDKNSMWAMGLGISYKILGRFRVSGEYFLTENHDNDNMNYTNPVSVGVCYQTSRHTFELFATNSSHITTNNYISQTTGKIGDGEIAVGFNVSIIFTVKH